MSPAGQNWSGPVEVVTAIDARVSNGGAGPGDRTVFELSQSRAATGPSARD